MVQFVHPSKNDITLSGVLEALADPMRLRIVKSMAGRDGCVSCSGVAPCPDMAKSTLSNHFRILRQAGLIHTEKRGVEHRNVLREAELSERFPGLLDKILAFAG